MMNPRSGASLDMSDYSIVAMVQGSLGEAGQRLGVAGRCRFCGQDDRRQFRTVAHSMPEAFGNKWVTSLDECDGCNQRFAAYDDALAKSMGAILTLGGVKGKKNKVRQTGRTGSEASIRHSIVDGKRSLSVQSHGLPLHQQVAFDPATGELLFRIPGGTERFIPVRAYRGLVKMGMALLPPERLAQFTQTLAWLQTPDGDLLPEMTVGISFSSIGNAPPLLAAALLERVSEQNELPPLLFVTTLGSVCLQVALRPDEGTPAWPQPARGRAAIRWTNHLMAPGEASVAITYDPPVDLDWGSAELALPVVEAVVTRFNPRTCEGRMTAVIRPDALSPRNRYDGAAEGGHSIIRRAQADGDAGGNGENGEGR